LVRYLILLPLLGLAAPAQAQVEDNEIWLTAGASVPLAEATKLGLEVTSRFSDDDGGLYEIEMSGLLIREVAKGVEIGVGYVRTPNYSRGTVTRMENRGRQQITAKFGKVAGGSLSGRFRIEERFRRGSDDMGVRLRPYLKYSLPLGQGATALVVSHESFLNLDDTDWGQIGGYERMRNLVGISTPLTKGVTLETGYLNQYRFAQGGSRDTMDHVGSANLSIAF
jgi:hypothetical protein